MEQVGQVVVAEELQQEGRQHQRNHCPGATQVSGEEQGNGDGQERQGEDPEQTEPGVDRSGASGEHAGQGGMEDPVGERLEDRFAPAFGHEPVPVTVGIPIGQVLPGQRNHRGRER